MRETGKGTRERGRGIFPVRQGPPLDRGETAVACRKMTVYKATRGIPVLG